MQCTCISSFNKNSPLLTFNICILYSRLRSNSITVFSTSTRFGTFHPAWLVRMCWIANSTTSTWNKQFKRQKKKDDQTNLNKEGVFQHWNVSFVQYDLQSNVYNGVFFFFLYWKYREETEGFQKRLNTSLHVALNSCNSQRLQIEILVSHTRTWNCAIQSPHINEHGNLCMTTIKFSSCN